MINTKQILLLSLSFYLFGNNWAAVPGNSQETNLNHGLEALKEGNIASAEEFLLDATIGADLTTTCKAHGELAQLYLAQLENAPSENQEPLLTRIKEHLAFVAESPCNEESRQDALGSLIYLALSQADRPLATECAEKLCPGNSCTKTLCSPMALYALYLYYTTNGDQESAKSLCRDLCSGSTINTEVLDCAKALLEEA